MHNQIAVRMRNRAQYVEEEPHPRLHAERMLIAVAIDLLTLDVFENEVRLTRAGDAGVEQLRDMWMSEASEDTSLALETFLSALPHQRNVEKLHCDFALKAAIVPLGKPDAPHSALTRLRYQ